MLGHGVGHGAGAGVGGKILGVCRRKMWKIFRFVGNLRDGGKSL